MSEEQLPNRQPFRLNQSGPFENIQQKKVFHTKKI